MTTLDDYIIITNLPQSADVQADLVTGALFQYQKSGGNNFIFNNHQPMHYAVYLEYPAGVVRGNHYHQHKEENLLVLTGEIKVKCWLLESSSTAKEYTLHAGQIINLKPGVAHACVSDQGASAVEFCPQPLDPTDSYSIKLLGEISDDDLGFTKSPERIAAAKTTAPRLATRIFLENNQGDLCVVKSFKHGYIQIPGGTVDPGESIVEGLKREAHEETGYELADIESLGYFIEHRHGEKARPETEPDHITFVFRAHASKNIGTNYMPDEKEEGFAPVWITPEQALQEYISQSEKIAADPNAVSYGGHFATRRDLILLQQYLKSN